MKSLAVIDTDKIYKHFQFFGFVDGTLAGSVSLNGVVMHTLTGESGSIANNAAESALKYGENELQIRIHAGAGEIEYAVLAVTGDEDDFDADHLVDIAELIAATATSPITLSYRFVLDGPAYAVLQR